MVGLKYPTYSKETIIFCDYNEWQKLGMILEHKVVPEFDLKKLYEQALLWPKILLSRTHHF